MSKFLRFWSNFKEHLNKYLITLEILSQIFDFSTKIRLYNVRVFIKIYFGPLRFHFLSMQVSFCPLRVNFAFKMSILGHWESIIVGIVESIFGPLGVDFWPLSNDRGVELGSLEVVIRFQGIEFRPLGFESRFFTHNVNFGPLLSDIGLLGV